MNSKQRRKAYRAMPKPGTKVTITRRSGAEKIATVIGLSMLFPQGSPCRGSVPSTNRILVQYPNGGLGSIRLSRIA